LFVFFVSLKVPRSGTHLEEINRHTTDESLYDSKVRRLADDPRQQGLGRFPKLVLTSVLKLHRSSYLRNVEKITILNCEFK
jgi:hypothetical protein